MVSYQQRSLHSLTHSPFFFQVWKHCSSYFTVTFHARRICEVTLLFDKPFLLPYLYSLIAFEAAVASHYSRKCYNNVDKHLLLPTPFKYNTVGAFESYRNLSTELALYLQNSVIGTSVQHTFNIFSIRLVRVFNFAFFPSVIYTGIQLCILWLDVVKPRKFRVGLSVKLLRQAS